MMKKQASKKVAYKINTYLIKNNITIIKLYMAQTLSSRDITIQISNEEEVEKLKKKDS